MALMPPGKKKTKGSVKHGGEGVENSWGGLLKGGKKLKWGEK